MTRSVPFLMTHEINAQRQDVFCCLDALWSAIEHVNRCREVRAVDVNAIRQFEQVFQNDFATDGGDGTLSTVSAELLLGKYRKSFWAVPMEVRRYFR